MRRKAWSAAAIMTPIPRFRPMLRRACAALLKEAVSALSLPADGEVTVADYGCCEGRNSMATIGTALGLLAARGVTGFGVLHNDLPTNDWDSLAKNLSSPSTAISGPCPQARALFAPHGFFERVTLRGSVTLGTSGSAAHWLSRQPPGLDMPRSLYRSDAPPAELAKILAQAAERLAGLPRRAGGGASAGRRAAGPDARLRWQCEPACV